MERIRHLALVGATSAIAQHCAREWLKGTVERITLVGRDAGRLERVAADLRVRGPGTRIDVLTGELVQLADIERLLAAVCADAVPDLALVAHGSLPDQAECQGDLAAAREALQVNAVSPALFAEGFAGRMQQAGGGTLVLVGSVAGDRGRKSNYVYGAAKGLVTRYAQGLQHRFAGSGVRVVLVKPGPTDTPMTAHLRARGASLAHVEEVAEAIVAGVARGQPVVYAPAKWALVMMVIRHLPRFVFHRMDI